VSREIHKLSEVITIRVAPYEKNFIQGLADLYAKGNVSLYLIYAAFNSERKFLEENDLPESRRMIRKGRHQTLPDHPNGITSD